LRHEDNNSFPGDAESRSNVEEELTAEFAESAEKYVLCAFSSQAQGIQLLGTEDNTALTANPSSFLN